MLEHTVAVVASRCVPVFVVAAPGQRLPAVAAQMLVDEVHGAGPLLATAQGLRAAAAAGADRAFVCAVDMPNLSGELVDRLVGYPPVDGEDGVDVVLPWDGRDHYLAGVYRTRLADRIDALAAAGRRSMRSLVGTVMIRRCVIGPADALAGALVNLNAPLAD